MWCIIAIARLCFSRRLLLRLLCCLSDCFILMSKIGHTFIDPSPFLTWFYCMLLTIMMMMMIMMIMCSFLCHFSFREQGPLHETKWGGKHTCCFADFFFLLSTFNKQVGACVFSVPLISKTEPQSALPDKVKVTQQKFQ